MRVELSQFEEPIGGNQAIHFAVLNGNKKLIDCLIGSFKANPYALTKQGLTAIHCAAQSERGVLSIVYFSQRYHISLDQKDSFDCTALHFAALNRY